MKSVSVTGAVEVILKDVSKKLGGIINDLNSGVQNNIIIEEINNIIGKINNYFTQKAAEKIKQSIEMKKKKEDKDRFKHLEKKKVVIDEDLFIDPRELITITFYSSDTKIDYMMTIPKTRTFTKIEKKLYEEFPEHKKNDNFFLLNGIKIDKTKTLEENGIKNGEIILLFTKDYDYDLN